MSKTLIALLVPVFACLAAAGAWADASGESNYATCVACHGDQAQGNQALNAPSLAHLEPVYIAAQLHKFRSGLRGGPGDSNYAMQMKPMAAVLPDDAAVTAVAQYIATFQPQVGTATVEGDAALGADYYNQFCGACHGPRAEGNKALNSPRLAGSDDWYLLRQLEAFRNGVRGTHVDDRTGRQMRAMAAVLPNEQALNDVVAFIQSIPQQ
jgi:cytochrome c553